VVAREAGRFVEVNAGGSLESIMAAHGSGAAALSERSDRAVIALVVRPDPAPHRAADVPGGAVPDRQQRLRAGRFELGTPPGRRRGRPGGGRRARRQP
jgi:hypothetical protein